MTLKRYSILRILQIEELIKLNIKGSVLDVGGKTPNNISNYLDTKVKYLDKFAKNEEDLIIDLEKEFNVDKIKLEQFDNVLLMNVLEHVFEFNNCIQICYALTKKEVILLDLHLYFRIHGSPNDYFRYTDQALKKF